MLKDKPELLDELQSLFKLEGDVLLRKYKRGRGWLPAILSDTTGGYHRVGLPSGRGVTVHKLVWALTFQELPAKDKEIDHIDGDRKNNKVSNLRVVTKAQNQSNRKPNSLGASTYKGVYKSGEKWISSISKDKVRTYLGTFCTEVAAAEAYNAAAITLNDNYRRINHFTQC